MKIKIYLIFALLLFITATLHAEVPQLVNYQGKLMQANGLPVTDGTYSIQFAVYDVPTGGTALWSETNASIQVKSGLFSVLLGSQKNLPENIFSGSSNFFAIKIGTNAEILPRQKITLLMPAITSAKLAASSIKVNHLSSEIALPPGGIIMWTGKPYNIPAGWALCDGTNGTPDLRNRFVVGAGDEYKVADIGGEKLHQLTVEEMPLHNHGGGSGGAYMLQQGADYSLIGNGSTNFEGGNKSHENRPPYYALCFIMKLGY